MIEQKKKDNILERLDEDNDNRNDDKIKVKRITIISLHIDGAYKVGHYYGNEIETKKDSCQAFNDYNDNDNNDGKTIVSDKESQSLELLNFEKLEDTCDDWHKR
ncbi:17677_t:CDS:2, partial [Cetraspora pellucida]